MFWFLKREKKGCEKRPSMKYSFPNFIEVGKESSSWYIFLYYELLLSNHPDDKEEIEKVKEKCKEYWNAATFEEAAKKHSDSEMRLGNDFPD